MSPWKNPQSNQRMLFGSAPYTWPLWNLDPCAGLHLSSETDIEGRHIPEIMDGTDPSLKSTDAPRHRNIFSHCVGF
jgi:hypothetical protein